MRPSKSPVFALLCLALVACPDETKSSDDSGYAVTCTTEVRTSVVLELLGDAGQNLVSELGSDGVSGTLTTEDGAEQPCEAIVDSLMCGWEAAGHLVVVATVDGYVPEQLEVDVAADKCHVITEQLSVQMTRLEDADRAAAGP